MQKHCIGLIAQLDRAAPCRGEGCRFDSDWVRLVEKIEVKSLNKPKALQKNTSQFQAP